VKGHQQGENNALGSKMPVSQLLACCYVILKMEGRFPFLQPQIVGQQLTLVNRTML
jgi:hypothetical protein